MAINLYTGTPGSGKSLDLARDIFHRITKKGGTVIGTFPIEVSNIKGKHVGTYIYKDYSELTPDYLYNFAKKNHVKGKEGQTLVIVDEAQILFNSRDFQNRSRMEWVKFMSLHRHYGYNIILSTQWDRMIDRQIRALVEYEYIHRKLNNFKLFQFLPFKVFLVVQYWYGVRQKIGHYTFFFKKKYAAIYDYQQFFEDDNEDLPPEEEVQEPAPQVVKPFYKKVWDLLNKKVI